MIILHGLWLNKLKEPKFFIWGESSEENHKSPKHLFQAKQNKLEEILSSILEEFITLGFEKAKTSLLLPTQDKKPIPSSTLLNLNHESSSKKELKEWEIDGLNLDSIHAAMFLISATDSPDLILGEDIKFWQKFSKFGFELLVRQRFFPHLIQKGKAFSAAWKYLIDDADDIRRMNLFSESMPPICRSFKKSDQSKNILSSFLSELTDTLSKKSIAGLEENITGGSIDETWFRSLHSEEDMPVDMKETENLTKTLDQWVSSIYSDEANAFKLCFKLDAPSSNSDIWNLNYLLQATDDPSLMVPLDQVWKEKGKTLKIFNRIFDNPYEKLLIELGKASKLFPIIDRSLRMKMPSRCDLSVQEAYSFLSENSWLLKESGYGVLLPSLNQQSSNIGVKVELKQPKTSVQGNGLGSIVDFGWKVAMGNQELSEEEFMKIASLKTPLVKIRGQWIELKKEEIENTLKLFESFNGRITVRDALRIASGGDGILPLTSLKASSWINELIQGLSKKELLKELTPPSNFNGSLRPYQTKGFSWLYFLRKWGIGACLADDMGLGKTIQFISLLLKNYESSSKKPSLLICPTSIVGNWQKEIDKFSPSLKILVHHGTGRLSGKEFIKKASKYNLVISTYSLIQRDIETLEKVEWDTVCLDEAQNIKNFWTKQSQAARKLKANHKIALTGTPIENRLSELWSIMDFLNPDYLGGFTNFKKNYIAPIELYKDKEKIQKLQKMVHPFILRRLKTDKTIISDLPEKMEIKTYCNLTKEQATLYQAVVNDMIGEIDDSEGIERKGRVLATLTKLKQVCNHPALFLKDKSKIEARSGKLSRLEEMLEEIVEVEDKALIFTQFAEMGKMIKEYLQPKFCQEILFLHGGVPRKKRDEMIQRFQKDKIPQIFVLSLKAGGFGLNLTSANHVFHFDRWWNPAVENQATDRVFRIGQKKNVEVHKFISVGTLEEKIDSLIERKKSLTENIIGTGEAWLTEMNTSELKKIFELRKDAVVE